MKHFNKKTQNMDELEQRLNRLYKIYDYEDKLQTWYEKIARLITLIILFVGGSLIIIVLSV